MSAHQWECKRCGATYTSPRRVNLVTCQPCSSRLGVRAAVLMVEVTP